MKENKGSRWTFVVVLAAVVAALTTVAVLVMRSQMRKKAMRAYNDTIDYDFDDCCGCDDEDCCGCEACETDQPVQIPLAHPDEQEPDGDNE